MDYPFEEPAFMRMAREAMDSVNAMNLKSAVMSPLGDLREQAKRYINPGIDIAKAYQSISNVQSYAGQAASLTGQAISVADLLGPSTAEMVAGFMKGHEIDQQWMRNIDGMYEGDRTTVLPEETMNSLCGSGMAAAFEEYSRMERQLSHAVEAADLLGMGGAQQAIDTFHATQAHFSQLVQPIQEALRSLDSFSAQHAIAAANLPIANFNPDLYIGSAARHLSMRGYADLATQLPKSFAKMDPMLRQGPRAQLRPNEHRRRAAAKRATSMDRRDLKRFRTDWVEDVRSVVRQEVEAAMATQKPRFFATYGFPAILAVASVLLSPVGTYINNLVIDALRHEAAPVPQMIPPPSTQSTHIVINRVEADASPSPKIILIDRTVAPGKSPDHSTTKRQPTRH